MVEEFQNLHLNNKLSIEKPSSRTVVWYPPFKLAKSVINHFLTTLLSSSI